MKHDKNEEPLSYVLPTLDPPAPFKEYPKTYENMFELKQVRARKLFSDLFGERGEKLKIGDRKGRDVASHLLDLFHLGDALIWQQACLSAYYLYHTKYKISKTKLFFPFLHGRSSPELLRMNEQNQKGKSRRVPGVLVSAIGGTLLNFVSIRRPEFAVGSWIYPTIGFDVFEKKNPIDHPEAFAYPWKYVTIAHLVLVHKLEDREHLIEMAEKKQMTWFDFADYVVNHTLSKNEEAGEEIYSFVYKAQVFIPYFNDHRTMRLYVEMNKGRSVARQFRVTGYAPVGVEKKKRKTRSDKKS